MFTDEDLYQRGAATLLASWQEYARVSAGAALVRAAGVAAAVLRREPERSVYNNALLDAGMDAGGRAIAIETMQAAYAAARITSYAAWVRESDAAMRSELECRGFALDSSTRAMGMALTGLRIPRRELELDVLAWPEYLRTFGMPAGLLEHADRSAFRIIVECDRGEAVASVMTFDLEGDCGVYNVGTVPHARRRGHGTAVTALALHDAIARGCQTASLQSTPMAERMYGALGFRDLGRILEYAPSAH